MKGPKGGITIRYNRMLGANAACRGCKVDEFCQPLLAWLSQPAGKRFISALQQSSCLCVGLMAQGQMSMCVSKFRRKDWPHLLTMICCKDSPIPTATACMALLACCRAILITSMPCRHPRKADCSRPWRAIPCACCSQCRFRRLEVRCTSQHIHVWSSILLAACSL